MLLLCYCFGSSLNVDIIEKNLHNLQLPVLLVSSRVHQSVGRRLVVLEALISWTIQQEWRLQGGLHTKLSQCC